MSGAYPCPLDEGVMVVEIPFTDEVIGDLRKRSPSLDEDTHAFAVWGEATKDIGPVIFLNENIREEDWFSDVHLSAIFAHELGHIHLNTAVEPEAERWGVTLLGKKGMSEAAHLLLNRGVLDEEACKLLKETVL
tara:strand:- start:23 stop:424 length:402 start_codon:yes stop_codon:yes gene_type:complete